MTRKRMNIIIVVLLVVFAFVIGVSGANASVSPDITEVFDQAYNGQGGFLDIPTTAGQNAYFSNSGGFVDYQSVSNGTYWVHPAGHDSLCLTESTTQPSQFKSEACATPRVSWQEFANVNNPGTTQYKILNNWSVKYVTDPNSGTGTYNATTGTNAAWGANGSTMYQQQ